LLYDSKSRLKFAHTVLRIHTETSESEPATEPPSLPSFKSLQIP